MNHLIALVCLAIGLVSLTAQPADAAARKFFKPTLLGDVLSACSGQSSGCGKPVADHFCRTKGFASALNYRLDRSGGNRGQARTIDNELVTVGSGSPTFVFVKCFSNETLDRK
ncbi:MAG: hypothetical protein AAGF81_01600 [Pseudomonadota bacterium]